MKNTHRKCGGAIAVAVMLTAHHLSAADLPVHEVNVLASKFAFDPPDIQVTAGELVRLVIRSNDTSHGFAIPKLKIDAQVHKGGEPVVVEFVAPPPGRFVIACSEFCGSGHGQMKAALVSVAPVTTGSGR
jgi:cytochrome c oxidase subunit 2